MKVVADANIPFLGETFGQHAEVVELPGREITRKDLLDADALVVRSVTAVDERLLGGTAVQFVGTCTIGTDHLDKAWLAASRMAWSDAPGCNADAAAQWTLAMMILACERRGMALQDLTVGIIGRGNVGSRLQKLLDALSIRSLACDPPLAEKGEPELVPLESILGCPVISLHVPLTRAGRHATLHLLNQQRLSQLADGTLLVNSARGDVIDETSLLAEISSGRIAAAIDTWPHEPCIHDGLLTATTVASPHVAGYSEEGKRNGLLAVYAAFCSHFGLEGSNLETPTQLELPAAEPLDATPWERLSRAVKTVCAIEQDDAGLRPAADMDEPTRSTFFDGLRRDYHPRREFSAWKVPDDHPDRSLLKALGFSL